MCTLAIYLRVGAKVPLLVAANRDEFLARPTAPPSVLSYDPWVVAGRDLEAGGTWLGLNEDGIIVGLLNRRSAAAPDPNRKSRGILTLKALQCRSVEAVEELLRREEGSDYNLFTLLAASRHRAVVAMSRDGRIDLSDLDPGLHVLTNLEVDDPTCPRIAASHQLFAALDIERGDLGVGGPGSSLIELQGILSSHSTQLDPRSFDSENGLCVHRGPYGTRSSTVIACAADPAMPARYWHAEGPPCRFNFEPVELPRSSD